MADWLDEIEARVNAATSGPWEWWDIGENSAGMTSQNGITGYLADDRLPTTRKQMGLGPQSAEFDYEESVLVLADESHTLGCDADFLATSRRDMPRLIDEVRRLRRQVFRYRDALRTIATDARVQPRGYAQRAIEE